MRPTVAQLRPVGNPLLTSMLIAYLQNEADFAARQAAPAVPVNEESGTYITLDTKHWNADKLERRAYGDTRAKGGFTFSSDTYKTLQWGLDHPIPDEHEATSQVPMRLESVGLQWLAHQSNIRKEIAFATDFMTTGVWTTNPTPTDWDDASGVPITDVRTNKRVVRQLVGMAPNALTMGEIVYDSLVVNAQIATKIQYTETQTVETVERLLAAVLGVQFLFVSKAVYNSANVAQTEVIAPIMDDDALLHIVKPGADMWDVSSIKTFTWAPGGGEGSAKSYYDDDRDSTILAHKEQWDQKLMAADSGVFFSDIV